VNLSQGRRALANQDFSLGFPLLIGAAMLVLFDLVFLPLVGLVFLPLIGFVLLPLRGFVFLPLTSLAYLPPISLLFPVLVGLSGEFIGPAYSALRNRASLRRLELLVDGSCARVYGKLPLRIFPSDRHRFTGVWIWLLIVWFVIGVMVRSVEVSK